MGWLEAVILGIVKEALANGRPELARSWMAVHLASVEAWLERALEPASNGAASA